MMHVSLSVLAKYFSSDFSLPELSAVICVQGCALLSAVGMSDS
jgi:hypothetical protein